MFPVGSFVCVCELFVVTHDQVPHPLCRGENIGEKYLRFLSARGSSGADIIISTFRLLVFLLRQSLQICLYVQVCSLTFACPINLILQGSIGLSFIPTPNPNLRLQYLLSFR